MVELTHDGAGRLELAGRYELDAITELDAISPDQNGVTKNMQYTFHKRLRVLPRKSVRKVKIRMSYEED